MPVPARVHAAIAVIALVATGAGYRWWNSPERQIARVLAGVAAALSHDDAETELQALTAVASLQTYLTADVAIDAGDSSRQLRGRQDVISTAARLRAATPRSRLQFFDPETEWAGESAATTRVTVQVIRRNSNGEDVADAHRVTIAFTRAEGRWLIARARVEQAQRSRL